MGTSQGNGRRRLCGRPLDERPLRVRGALAARDQALEISCLTGMQETEKVVRWLKARITEGASHVAG
jgi:hypothetical protein